MIKMAPVLDVFVPDGDSREETAVLLTGTAAEHGIPQNHVRAAQGGFFISDALADLVYSEVDPAEQAAAEVNAEQAAAEQAAAEQAAAEQAAAEQAAATQ